MKKLTLLSFLVIFVSSPIFATEISSDHVQKFLCNIGLCRNEAVISQLTISKYNLPNLAEKLSGSGSQVLVISFHQEAPNREFRRNYSNCNLIVLSETKMKLSACAITGFVAPGSTNRVNPLVLGENEIISQKETGWLATEITN